MQLKFRTLSITLYGTTSLFLKVFKHADTAISGVMEHRDALRNVTTCATTDGLCSCCYALYFF